MTSEAWYTVRPISDRQVFTGQHENSPFTAGWSDTIDLLERELAELAAEHVVLEVDVAERAIRVDGMLRADARATSPAVRVAFDSRHGPLQYATDRYVRPSWRRDGMQQDWQHNVRAIALGLEALRKVDRYGITKRGEQYAGWKALPAGESAIAMPAAMTVEQAARFIIDQADSIDPGTGAMLVDATTRLGLYRRAAKRLHPDNGGDAVLFQQLQDARQLLDAENGPAAHG
ncbi:J domain-containing protein [Blastococcus sp. CT_GayMR16]|uniref:J domain-containing protein n=1 Tax=Blastococcus sp. CT_GayMR16 TaxID=2559607 RepID=UPI001074822B|nr:J domain-containing protein [Blastococcus sp. CT_GayMR16]TFV83135.1 J domain-containing protein [Blastococcus sp. CT_GayMR16]